MPGHGLPQVKCEPSSEDEDSNSQFAHGYLSNQLITSELHPVKLEPDCHSNENVPSDILHHLQNADRQRQARYNPGPYSGRTLWHTGGGTLEELAPAAPAATPVRVKPEPAATPPATLEVLQSAPNANATKGSTLLDRHMTMMSATEVPDSADFMPLLAVKDEPVSDGEQLNHSGDDTSDSSTQPEFTTRGSPKSWTQKDMDNALEALRKHNMSLTRASAMFGIPSTTLWQRAHRLGIDTPKKEGAAKSWSEADLRQALHALRAGAISANKASKAYGIPSSTLYKIARREGIRLAAPFNAAPTAWRRADLTRALEAIRAGDASVQRAASLFGIPTGTLYGRCKREGIELSRSNPTPWSEDAMGEALEAVRVGQMSINQAAIHYNLPYSSLYGRFKRCKYPPQGLQPQQDMQKPNEMEPHHAQDLNYYQQMPSHTVHHHPEPDSLIHSYIPMNEHDASMLQGNYMQDHYSGQAMYYAQSCNMAS